MALQLVMGLSFYGSDIHKFLHHESTLIFSFHGIFLPQVAFPPSLHSLDNTSVHSTQHLEKR